MASRLRPLFLGTGACSAANRVSCDIVSSPCVPSWKGYLPVVSLMRAFAAKEQNMQKPASMEKFPPIFSLYRLPTNGRSRSALRYSWASFRTSRKNFMRPTTSCSMISTMDKARSTAISSMISLNDLFSLCALLMSCMVSKMSSVIPLNTGCMTS